jgi:hypothetical protein
VFSKKLIFTQLVKKCALPFLTRAHHWIKSCARWIQPTHITFLQINFNIISPVRMLHSENWSNILCTRKMCPRLWRQSGKLQIHYNWERLIVIGTFTLIERTGSHRAWLYLGRGFHTVQMCIREFGYSRQWLWRVLFLQYRRLHFLTTLSEVRAG